MEMNQDRLIIFLVVVIAISGIALLYAWMLYCSVKKEDSGSRKLKELSSFIHEGAMAFLKREYKIIILFIAAVAVILCSLGMIPSLQGIDGVGLNGAICFVVGTLCSGIAGFIGMKAATAANAVSRKAQEPKVWEKHCTLPLTEVPFSAFAWLVSACWGWQRCFCCSSWC